MATRSRIGKLNDDGTVTSIYCHSDGYPEYVGRILYKHWDHPTMVETLISLGDISCLGDTREDTIDYRSWGETAVEPITHKANDWPSTWEEWRYLYVPSRDGWMVQAVDEETGTQWTKLGEYLKTVKIFSEE